MDDGGGEGGGRDCKERWVAEGWNGKRVGS